jgi:hypothetical protein
MELIMKKITALTAALAISATSAFAGNPTVVADDPMPEVFEETPVANKGYLVLGGILLIAALALAASSDDDTADEPT